MEKHYSADGQFYIALTKTRIRLFQWIHAPVICSSDDIPIFDLSQNLWDASHITWQKDRNQLQCTLRCHSSATTEINIYLDPETKNCILIENELIRNMSFDKALAYLKSMESQL